MKEAAQTPEVLKRNQQYDTFLKVKIGSDNYANRMSQTFNFNTKNKEVQCNRQRKCTQNRENRRGVPGDELPYLRR